MHLPTSAGKKTVLIQKKYVFSYAKGVTETVLAGKDEGQERKKAFPFHPVFLGKQSSEVLQ